MVGDPDHAGQEAVARAIPILISEGLEIQIVPCPMVLQLKTEATKKVKNPQPFRELVFLHNYNKQQKEYSFMHNKMMLEVQEKEITELVKIDPDELVRMYQASTTE